ncbi:MAG: FG-GAP repeat domain-containing protein, partial [Planctomycetota bacterium]
MKRAKTPSLEPKRFRPSWLLLLFFLLSAFPSSIFAEEGPYFSDVAVKAGLGEDERGFRQIFGDFDGDGYADIALVHPGQGRTDGWRGKKFPIQGLLLNRKKGDGRTFEDVTKASGILKNRNPDVQGFGCQVMAAADVDNDGDLDLFCGSYNYPRKPRRGEPDNGDRNEIFLNNGKARFTMVPFSGLGLEATTTSAAVFCDVNNDGKIDLFLGNWYQTYPPMRIRAQGNPLYLGLGHGIFKDVTAEMGLATKNAVGAPGGHRPTYGLSHCDFNNDGWQDLLVCNYGRQANRLWMNVKGEKFVDVGPKVGFDGDAHRKDAGEPPFRQHGNTFAAQCADYDNDGDIDVFLAETTHADSRRRHADASCLLRNRGKEHDFVFERLPLDTLPRAPIARIGEWGDHYAGWLDFDNDGLLDLLVAPSSYRHQVLLLFRQKPDHGFEEIGERAGIRIPDPHGLALADIDRDGDVDILCCSIPRATPNKEKGKF